MIQIPIKQLKNYMKLCYSLILLLFLQSCANPNKAQKLLNNIESEISKRHKLSYSKLIAVYDLPIIHVGSKSLYSKDLGRVLNEDHHNTGFLRKFSSKRPNDNVLRSAAGHKLEQARGFILRLDNIYHFLSRFESQILSNRKDEPIRALSKLDKILEFVPIMSPEYPCRLSSKYGMRKHPVKGQSKFHCGLDLITNCSGPVYAAASGVVEKVYYSATYGNLVEINHLRFKTRYAHLKTSLVHKGQAVIRGQQIGLQGKTGCVTGEHLHFEVWLHGKHVNPFDFIITNIK